MITIREYKASAVRRLAEAENSFVRQTPRLDVELIMSHVLEQSRTWLFLHDDQVLTERQVSLLDAAMEKRLSGLPVAYITGEKEFFGRTFHVSQDVLIPKPDTELLVEKALEHAARLLEGGKMTAAGEPFRIADVCTGSGCIGISVLAELAGGGHAAAGGFRSCISVEASDISEAALSLARKNAAALLSGNAPGNISFVRGDLCSPLPSRDKGFHMILSNPPYVPASVTDELLSDGRGEPRLALDGDMDTAASCGPEISSGQAEGMWDGGTASDDGLAIIRRLIPQVWDCLLPGGVFLMETGEYNAEKASFYLSKQGFTDIVIHRDLAGQLRLVESHR